MTRFTISPHRRPAIEPMAVNRIAERNLRCWCASVGMLTTFIALLIAGRL